MYVAASLLVVCLVYQLLALRRDPRNPVRRGLAVMFGALTVAVVPGVEPVYLAFDAFVGVPNAARYVQHLGAITGFCAVQILLRFVARDPAAARAGVWPRVGGLVAVAAVMLVLFSLAPLDVEAPDDFVERYGGAPWVAPYLVLYLAYLTVGVVDVVVSCQQHARRSGDTPWLRLSFRLLQLAGVIGLAYLASKLVVTVAVARGIRPPMPDGAVSRVLVSAGAICAATAVLLPVVRARVVAARDWRRRWRLHRTLYPLWMDIARVVPHVRLHGSGRHGRLAHVRDAVLDMPWLLYRRVIEIQDGLLDLRFHRDPDAAPTAATLAERAGLSGAEFRAVVEAADIVCAVRAMETGATARVSDGAVPPLTQGADDLPAWLGRVARAYADSPVVALTRQRLAGTERAPRS
jgi:hypothetical protein